MKRKMTTYTRETKDEAVKRALASGSIGQTAKAMKIPLPTLANWVLAAKKTLQKIVTDNASNASDKPVFVSRFQHSHPALEPLPKVKKVKAPKLVNELSETENKELKLTLEKLLKQVEVLKAALKLVLETE